jgi:hypothetical protein
MVSSMQGKRSLTRGFTGVFIGFDSTDNFVYS